MKWLIDASVVVKWIAVEPDSELAMKFYDASLVAPPFMLLELSNILWKKVRQRELVPSQATSGLTEVQKRVSTPPARGFEPRALEIGLELDHSIYDCLYLALAEVMDTPIITADRRLVASCAGTRFARLVELLA